MENNQKTLSVGEVLTLNDTINMLFEEHIKYPVNIGYKLYRLKNELNEISEYSINRIVEVLPNIVENSKELSDVDKAIYQTIINSPVDIDTYGLTREDIYCVTGNGSLDNPMIDVADIGKLELLF